MSRRSCVKKVRIWITIIAVVSVLFVGSTATPAAAGTCTTQWCGGVVSNNSSSSIAVTNCWPGTSTRYYGDTLSCMTNGWAYNKRNAGMLLGRGDSTLSYYYYYDTDGFRVFKGCKVIGYWGGLGGTPFSFDRHGYSTSMWVKINNWDYVYISSITC